MSDRPAPLAPPNKALPTFETPEDRNARHRAFMERADAATSGRDCIVSARRPPRPPRQRNPIARMSELLQDYARGGMRNVKFPILPRSWASLSLVEMSDPVIYDEPVQTFEIYLPPIVSEVRVMVMGGTDEALAWYCVAGNVRRQLIAAGGQWE